MKRRMIAGFAVLTMATACAPAAPKHDPATDLAAIGKLRDSIAAAYKAGNAAGVASLFTADGRMMESGQPTAEGTQAIEGVVKGLNDAMGAIDVTIVAEKTEVSGDLAYDRGTFKMTMTPKGASAPIVEAGRYLVVVKRQADGSWKIAEDMGNSATSPESTAAVAPAKKK